MLGIGDEVGESLGRADDGRTRIGKETPKSPIGPVTGMPDTESITV